MTEKRRPKGITLRLRDKGALCDGCPRELIKEHAAVVKLEWHEVDERGEIRGGLQSQHACWRAIVLVVVEVLGREEGSGET